MQYKLNGRLNFVRLGDTLLIEGSMFPDGLTIEGDQDGFPMFLREEDTVTLIFTDKIKPGQMVTVKHFGAISIYCRAREDEENVAKGQLQEVKA
jgi:hypothetical protein